MRRSAALLITLSAALVAAPTAGAWTNAAELTPASGVGTVQGVAIGMSPAGEATAIWGAAGDYRNTSYAINATNHQVGQNDPVGKPAWSGDTLISDTGASHPGVQPQETSNGLPRMSVGVGPGGSVMAAWTTRSATNNEGQISTASRSASGLGFSAPKVITTGRTACPNPSTPPSTDPSVPLVSVNAGGTGHVSWFGACASSAFPLPVLFTQAFDAAGLAANALSTESSAVSNHGGSTISPQVSEAPDGGSAVLAYTHDATPNQAAIGVTYDRITASTLDQRVTGKQTVGHTTASSGVRVAALPNGGQIVAWIDSGVHVSIDDGVDTVIPRPGQNVLARNLSLSAGADGTAVLAWTDANGGAVWGAVRSPGGAVGAPAPGRFGAPTQLSAADGDANNVRTAVSANGTGYAVWNRDTGAFDGVEGSIVDPLDPNRSPGTPWQFQPVADTLISGGFDTGIQGGDALPPAIAVDAAGDADVIAPVEIPHTDTSGNTAARYAIAMVENRSTRPAPAGPTPTPTPAPTDAPVLIGPVPAPAATPAPAPPAPTLVISGFQLTRIYFATGTTEGKKVTAAHEETLMGIKPKTGLRIGTQINYTLTQPATVRVRVSILGCFDPSLSRKASKSRTHCSSKKQKVGTVVANLTAAGKKGANSIPFTDKVLAKKDKLVAGTRYAVELTGVDPGTGRTVVPLRTPEFDVTVDAPLE